MVTLKGFSYILKKWKNSKKFKYQNQIIILLNN